MAANNVAEDSKSEVTEEEAIKEETKVEEPRKIASKKQILAYTKDVKKGKRYLSEDYHLPSLGGSIKIAPPIHEKMASVQTPVEKIAQMAQYARQAARNASEDEEPLDEIDVEMIRQVNEESNMILIHCCIIEPELTYEECKEFVNSLPEIEQNGLLGRCLYFAAMSSAMQAGAENFFGSTPF